ncbi:ammonium transporter, partial [uncultured Mailhella sp.]|uniref:ammonium transporter n=1 Tax=uncultured Mailhella sp. TaxID=1981031 RepID=UPI00345BA768
LPHNIPMTVLGAGLLWFGWFGFNAGSALAANGLAANALVTTHLSAGCAILGWLAVERWHTGHFTVLGAASGAVAGLVVITPAAGFVEPWAAIVMGLLGGAVCYGGIFLKRLFNYDDALDVVGIHGVGGVLGALLTGVFACAEVNGVDGLLYGNPHQLWVQFVSVVATVGFCFPVSFALLKLTDKLVGLRVPLEKEVTGLDISEHSESGYQI